MGAKENTEPSQQEAVRLAGAEDSRLRFSGTPDNVSGVIPLVNTSSEKQKVRAIEVSADKLLGPAKLPLREILFQARVYAGEQVNAPARLVLDPQTPPGSYDFELTLGERTLPATAFVSEVVDLRLDPAQMTILAGAVTSYKRTLVVENAGNVPLPTGAECEAPIFEANDIVSTFLIGLSKGDRASAEAMTKAFLNEWAELKAGTLITKRKAMTIAPGQKLAVEIEFQIPGDLKPLRHYRAKLQLYNAHLSVDIYTTAKAGSKREAIGNRRLRIHE